MAPDPQCTAVAAAKQKSGLSYAAIAAKIGLTEQHVIDICTGSKRPTTTEFEALAKALGITSPLPSNNSHTAQSA
ncbi:hypothetical protein C0993_001798 [Termitomyces sp. T159_Od127]|nr:hypothetical protein C0993_001798 [Termitomyces sp. T159_Od127]